MTRKIVHISSLIFWITVPVSLLSSVFLVVGGNILDKFNVIQQPMPSLIQLGIFGAGPLLIYIFLFEWRKRKWFGDISIENLPLMAEMSVVATVIIINVMAVILLEKVYSYMNFQFEPYGNALRVCSAFATVWLYWAVRMIKT